MSLRDHPDELVTSRETGGEAIPMFAVEIATVVKSPS